jgi:hypothetical protein
LEAHTVSQLIRSRYIQVFPFDDETNICPL